MFALPIFVILIINRIHARDVDYCFADEDDPYLNMATKTAYHFVHAGKTRFQSIPNCYPAQVWMLATHGTRCPSSDEITRMLSLTDLKNLIISNHETRGNGRMCNRDLENLKRWQPDAYFARERAEVLTPQGVEDMRLLARRLQSNFPEILRPNGDVIPSDYKFKTIDARNSMEAFMEGLFGSKTEVPAEYEQENETLLAGYQNCDPWWKAQNRSMKELEDFEKSSVFENLVQNVSKRLGFLYNLDKDPILTMYDVCRYEKAWTVTKLSSWCAVFSKEELRVLEYREDLEYYYKAGYGNEINSKLGCVVLEDMMNHFRELEEGKTAQPKGVFYFSDIITLQNLLTSLEINKDDEHLMASNYKEMAKRQWRTSFISPFAANLVAAFYECDGNTQPHKVMFYLAEKPVLFKGCDVGLCDWEYLKRKFGPTVSQCNPDFCFEGSGAPTSLVPSLSLVLLAHIFLVSFRQ